MKENSALSKVDQIGIVVGDINRAIEYYQSLGIGPFETLPHPDIIERKIWGKPVAAEDVGIKTEIARIGPIELELIEPVKGETPWKTFLEKKGEGICHLAFYVDNIDEAESELLNKGFSTVYRSRFRNGGGAALFDTGGFFIELIQV